LTEYQSRTGFSRKSYLLAIRRHTNKNAVGLLLATMYLVLALCSRIYRAGILMYGKRPTLPEIVKWVKYS